MKNHSYRCDYCARLKGESNHWWLRVPGKKPGETMFTLQCWDNMQADVTGYEHICSESCAAKALSKWMTHGDAHPEAQVLAVSDMRVQEINNKSPRR
jgi:hypothetical protein